MDEPPVPSKKPFWPDWLTPRRFIEFGWNVVKLEAKVQTLIAETQALRAEVIDLERKQAVQTAQIQMLTTFLAGASGLASDADRGSVVERSKRNRPSTNKTKGEDPT